MKTTYTQFGQRQNMKDQISCSYYLEAKPANIYEQVFPVRILESDWIDKAAWEGVSWDQSQPRARNIPNMTADLPNS